MANAADEFIKEVNEPVTEAGNKALTDVIAVALRPIHAKMELQNDQIQGLLSDYSKVLFCDIKILYIKQSVVTMKQQHEIDRHSEIEKDNKRQFLSGFSCC